MVHENAKVKLALAFPTGAPMTVPNEAIEMLPLFADKTIFTHYFSFMNFSYKIIFGFIDFIESNLLLIIYIWIHIN